MKHIYLSLFNLLIIIFLVSCSGSEQSNTDTKMNDSVSSSIEQDNKQVSMTPEEIIEDKKTHPEKYIVISVDLDNNSTPPHYNVVVVNNSGQTLKKGTVVVEYDLSVGTSHMNTVREQYEIKNIKSGGTSIVTGQNWRIHKGTYTPLSSQLTFHEFSKH